MSEQSAEVRRFDDGTPESAVVRYAWNIGKMEELGLDYYDSAYRNALIELNDIFNSVATPTGLTFEAIKDKVMPLPFDESGLDPKMWSNLLRMAPALMLDRGVPEMDSITPKYARCVIYSSLAGETGHGKECMSMYHTVEKYDCLVSELCPVQAVYNVMTRLSGDLLVRRRIFSDIEQGSMNGQTYLLISNIQNCFLQHGMADKEQFETEVYKFRDQDWAVLETGLAA